MIKREDLPTVWHSHTNWLKH